MTLHGSACAATHAGMSTCGRAAAEAASETPARLLPDAGMEGLRVLVTGGVGFIGDPLTRALAAAGAEVLVLDSFRQRGPAALAAAVAGRGRIVCGDVRRRGDLRRCLAERPQVVVHLAALHYLPYCNAHPRETLEVNAIGTRRLLAACAAAPPRAILLASTAAVYGLAAHPHREGDPRRPFDPYSRSKAASEDLLERFARDHPKTRCVSARFFNVFGPGETNLHVIPKIVRTLAAGARLELGNVWPRRDYVYVDDVVRALVLLAAGEPGYDAFNVATGRGASVADVVDVLRGLVARPFEVVADAEGRRRDGHLLGEPAKLQAAGWSARVSLEEGLRRTLEAEAPHLLPEAAEVSIAS